MEANSMMMKTGMLQPMNMLPIVRGCLLVCKPEKVSARGMTNEAIISAHSHHWVNFWLSLNWCIKEANLTWQR